MIDNETTQPGLAPGSFWRVLSPAGQKRVIIATVREALELPEPAAVAKVLPATEELRRHEAKLKGEQLGLI
jgi:hypothetical protein